MASQGARLVGVSIWVSRVQPVGQSMTSSAEFSRMPPLPQVDDDVGEGA